MNLTFPPRCLKSYEELGQLLHHDRVSETLTAEGFGRIVSNVHLAVQAVDVNQMGHHPARDLQVSKPDPLVDS